jgi:hypothetical protein
VFDVRAVVSPRDRRADPLAGVGGLVEMLDVGPIVDSHREAESRCKKKEKRNKHSLVTEPEIQPCCH